MFSVQCLVCLVCAVTPPAKVSDEPNTATLIVMTAVIPGSSQTQVEYVRGDTLVRCKVSRGYNVPTGEESYSGNLHPIFLVASGRSHADTRSIVDLERLIKALKSLPLTVTERVLESEKSGAASNGRRFDITFRAPESATAPSDPTSK